MAIITSTAVDISNLSFRYPGNEEPSFTGLNLQIAKGERFGLFGPNGAGKTTLMNLMTGLLKSEEGSITLNGEKVGRHKYRVNKLFGFVPQDFSFYQELSPVENLEFFGAWYGLNSRKIKQKTDELLQVMGLEDVRDKQVQQFSGGMKRRVNLAIGVIHNPGILFLDEPTVGVDVQTRHAIINYLLELNTNGTTLIYTSHQLSEAEDLCNQVALMDHGQIKAQGALDTLLQQHKQDDLEELFLSLTGKNFGTMFKLWATIVKDVRVLLRDKVGILLMFIMPVALVIVVTSIQNSTFQLMNKNKLLLLISNQDTGKLSPQLIKAIDNIGMFRVKELPKGADSAIVTAKLHAKDAELAIIIPKDFSARVSERAKASSSKALKSFGLAGDSVKVNSSASDPINMYYNPVLQEQLRLSVQGALRSALQLVESRETLRDLYISINDKPLPAKLENEMLSSKTTINQVPVSRNGNRLIPNATQHNVPAWTIFAMFFIVMSLGGSVVREKISGSFIRLKTMPTNYLTGLLSKQITYLGVTMIQALVIFAIGVWLFPLMNLPALNIPDDIAGLILVTVLTGWCAVSYAICVGVFAKTQEQANGFGAVSIVIMAAIGGLMVPSYVVSGPMKALVNFSPLHWCIEAYYDLFLEGGKLSDVVANIIPLIAITLLLQVVTVIGLKRKNLI